MEEFLRETGKERVAIINTGGDKAVDKNGGTVGGEGGAKADIYSIRMCRT